jgi:hypothetical protein
VAVTLPGDSTQGGISETREYDLRGLRRDRWDIIPYFHAGVLIGGVLLAGWIGYLTYLAWVDGGVPRLLRPQDLFLFATFPGVFFLLGLIFLVTRPSANSCSWDPEGVTFHYPNGKSERRSWADSRFHLTVVEITSRKEITYGTNALGLLPANAIPRDLYLNILREALRQGLPVTTQLFRGFGTKTISNEIHGKV